MTKSHSPNKISAIAVSFMFCGKKSWRFHITPIANHPKAAIAQVTMLNIIVHAMEVKKIPTKELT